MILKYLSIGDKAEDCILDFRFGVMRKGRCKGEMEMERRDVKSRAEGDGRGGE